MRAWYAFAGFVGAALFFGLAGPAHGQTPIRIGASLSQTGAYADPGQNQLRGYQLCVKHANEKGGVLERKVDLITADDRSQSALAVKIYEKLIVQDKVDAILGPYSSPITEFVADVSEKFRMPMIAPGASLTSIFKKGRKYIFMVYSPAEVYFEGLVDMAAKRGLKTIAIFHESTGATSAIAQGAADAARRRNLQVLFVDAYPKGTLNFRGVLRKVETFNPDVVAAAGYFNDQVAITRQMRELKLNPKMFGMAIGPALPKFYETLGSSAESIYGASQWEPGSVKLAEGGARYPGAREFVEAYRTEFPGMEPSYHSASGYAGCGLLLEAIKRAGSLDRAKLRETLLAFDVDTIFGPFKVDGDGFQIGHRMQTFQWRNGNKVIVWPEEPAR
jgi:branched-chain amino acid transport system substrate-binding protein